MSKIEPLDKEGVAPAVMIATVVALLLFLFSAVSVDSLLGFVGLLTATIIVWTAIVVGLVVMYQESVHYRRIRDVVIDEGVNERAQYTMSEEVSVAWIVLGTLAGILTAGLLGINPLHVAVAILTWVGTSAITFYGEKEIRNYLRIRSIYLGDDGD